MMTESSITKKGQTTLPKSVREFLGLRAGDKVRYLVRDDVKQFEVARMLQESLTTERPGYICWEFSRLEGVSLLDGHAS